MLESRHVCADGCKVHKQPLFVDTVADACVFYTIHCNLPSLYHFKIQEFTFVTNFLVPNPFEFRNKDESPIPVTTPNSPIVRATLV